ncbi:MAG: periplasmic heavy metal sensor [Proteobacteria bacterium]|nr:periplasmic heavy metal sensor [Pseudomonadota bacterium]MBU1057080.1 periplasmic heavy metal sensor [Pseudomonadota bacterium]
MKKIVAVSALVIMIGLSGVCQVSANWGPGNMMGGGSANCPQNRGQITAPMDAETKAKFDKFYEETLDLRKEIVVKRAVKHALMRAEQPDSAAIGKVTGELFDLHNAMRIKAQKDGLQGFRGMGQCEGCCDDPGCQNGCRGMRCGQALMDSQ